MSSSENVMTDDGISKEDKALFRQAMKMVTPLHSKGEIAQSATKTASPARETTPVLPQQEPVARPAISLSSYYHEEVQPQTILSYASHGIPAKRFRELKAGQIRWQARLDLHGLTIETARETLPGFIVQQYEKAHRCVLIIHGKGSHHGEPPILKNLVNHWLRQIPVVLAFHSAQPRDGGTGALYVLLKRRRDNSRFID
ncbi:Smr/MutS family protein [Legionella spiritensis]